MKKSFTKRSKAVRLSPRAIIYPFLWIFALLFTQFLRNSVSNAFFWFVCIFPVLSVVYALIGRGFVQVYVSSDTVRCEKGESVGYEIRLINSSPFPLPHIEAFVTEPSEDGVRCLGKTLIAELTSFGGCVINNTVVFPYRGSYDIGVESIYVYDLLGMIAFRTDVFNYAHVTVYPRRLGIERDRMKDMTNDSLTSSERKNTSEISEPSDIKDYVFGDPIKSIHWKLSSKSEDIKVRKYDSVENRHTYIFCDLSASSKLPKKTPSEIYKSLKAILSPRESSKVKKLKSLRTRVAAVSEMENIEAQVASGAGDKKKSFSGIAGYLRMKKTERTYRKNIRRGMSEEQARTVEMVDELISSTSKAERRRMKKEAEKSVKKQTRLSEKDIAIAEKEYKAVEKDGRVQSELDRILASTKEKEAKISRDEVLFGGRVKEKYSADFDELCADSVVEMTVALVYDELMKGSTCTLCWFDPREDTGISLFDFSSLSEFEPVFSKLATSPVVEEGAYVSALTLAITDTNAAKVRIVTSNIDPVSIGETESIPAKLGGASGCNAEVLIFSPYERYENPVSRSQYTSDAVNRFISNGIRCSVWADNGTSFVPVG